jgi:hypothetical protein
VSAKLPVRPRPVCGERVGERGVRRGTVASIR